MKNFNFKTCMIAALGVVLVSCDQSGEDSSPPKLNLEDSVVTLKSRVDVSRIKDLESPSFAASSTPAMAISRAAAGDSSPAAPVIPAGAVSMVGKDLSYGITAGSVYYLPEGESYSGQLMFTSDVKYYIAGDLTLSYYNEWGKSGGEILVLEGGSLTVSGNLTDITVKSWGETIFNSDFEINHGGAFYNYSSAPFDAGSHHLSLRGTFYSASDVLASTILCSGDYKLHFAGCVYAEQEFYAENHANIYLDRGLQAEYITLDSYAKLYLLPLTHIDADHVIYNNDSRFINQSSEGYAVIDIAKRLKIHNNTYFERMSGGEIRLQCPLEAIEDDNSQTPIQWSASVKINAEDSYISPDDSCFGGFGSDNGGDKDEPKLEHVTQLTSPDYERISATSIDFKDGHAFVSWHERGVNYQGYIDVVNMSDLEIAATFYTTELDFNHIYVAPNDIYVTGGSRKGAFYSSLDYSIATSSVDIDVVGVAGASGNCIVQEAGYNWVVSGAVGGLTRTDGAESTIYKALEEAKFVAPYGDKMAVLAGVAPAEAMVYEFNTSAELTSSYVVGQIPTVDGKNALLADGDDLYASLGEGGLKIFSGGVEKASFSNVDGSGSVNCTAVDDDHIYIANGVAGLYILDKTSLEVIKTYQLGQSSANYVKLGDNGLIYVAYGLDGVHVFKFSK